ncbi:MAG TPA: hypothetical protein DEA08_30020 [Planctomycetes bacterium]|nr:hypothetical protein [Planctomycetota bacterium]
MALTLCLLELLPALVWARPLDYPCQAHQCACTSRAACLADCCCFPRERVESLAQSPAESSSCCAKSPPAPPAGAELYDSCGGELDEGAAVGLGSRLLVLPPELSPEPSLGLGLPERPSVAEGRRPSPPTPPPRR